MKTTISTTIDVEVKERAIEFGVPLSKALDFGVKFLIAETEGVDYPESKQEEKTRRILDNFNEQLQRVKELEDRLEKYEPDFITADKIEQIEEEAHNILKGSADNE